ncbi:MAG: site-specific integrase [Fuerstiella sp.]
MKKGQRKRLRSLKRPKPSYNKKKRRWVARVLMSSGKYRTRFCETKEQAYEAIAELWDLREVREVDRIVLEDLVEKWMAAGDWKASTRADYSDTAKNFKDLHGIPLEMITPESVQQILDGIDSTAARKRVRSTLRTCFNWAKRRKMLRANPILETEPVSHRRAKIEVFRPEETDSIIEQMSHRWQAPVQLMLVTGLRPGECWGLEWRDWSDGVLQISRAVKEVDGKQIIEPTKTESGMRALPLSESAELILRQRQVEAMKSGHAGKRFPIFANTRGGYIRQGNFRHKVWRPAMIAAGLDYKVPYTLRHSFATWSLNGGCRLAAVSKYLGHADQVTTLKHYSHLMVGELEQVARFWDQKTG